MSPSDHIVKVEMFKIEQLVALGLGRYEAIQAVEAGIDVRTAELLAAAEGLDPARRGV
jgi:hypothetical protein